VQERWALDIVSTSVILQNVCFQTYSPGNGEWLANLDLGAELWLDQRVALRLGTNRLDGKGDGSNGKGERARGGREDSKNGELHFVLVKKDGEEATKRVDLKESLRRRFEVARAKE